MSDTYNDVQKLTVDPVIELWELDLGSSYAYFYSGVDASLGSIQFRNRTTPANINTYDALPIQGEGFALKTEGAIVRPTLTVANILSTFSDALGGLKNKDLLGKRIYRRRTLQKYLYSEGDTTNPPIEFPTQMYYLDRISSENRLAVTFELSAPYDLTGLRLPRRTIIGNGCSWKYTGHDPTLSAGNREGGCTWNRYSRTNVGGTTYIAYFNKENEPVVPIAAVYGTYTSGSITKGHIWRTAAPSSIRQVNKNGSVTAPSTTVYDYWQATDTYTSPTFPSDGSPHWRRVRVFTNYSSATTYYVYTDPRYNNYVARIIGGESYATLFKVQKHTQLANSHDTAPLVNAYWTKGDQCGKTLQSCRARFDYNPIGSNGQNVPSPIDRNVAILPFGGFPAARFTT